MTDDTVRATAQAMPDADEKETALNITEEALERAHTRWLRSRAARKDPDGPHDDESVGLIWRAEAAAARDFMLTPITNVGYIWEKIEVFEVILGEELRDGLSRNSDLLLAFGALKQDLFNLDLGVA